MFQQFARAARPLLSSFTCSAARVICSGTTESGCLRSRLPRMALSAAGVGTIASLAAGQEWSWCLSEVEALRQKCADLQAELDATKSKDQPIYRVVLTGGPCGGKSTAMNKLKEHFENLGWRVYMVPEGATMLISMGMQFADFFGVEDNTLTFQVQLARLQMALENGTYELAKTVGKKSIILCDRGVMDDKAYCPPGVWPMVLEELGMSVSQVRDKRYEAVIHLVTAAKGAEKFYTKANNAARHETVDQARELDEKTLACWVGHDHLYIVDNSTSFQEKIKRTVDRILNLVGEPDLKAARRKVLVQLIDIKEVEASLAREGRTYEIFDVDQTFLSDNQRIRCRRQGQHASYYMQTETAQGNVGEQLISPRMYLATMAAAQQRGNATVQKRMLCFKWGGMTYEVNFFTHPEPAIVVELEAECAHGKVDLPPFLKPIKEVTRDPTYHSYNQAMKLKNDLVKAGKFELLPPNKV